MRHIYCLVTYIIIYMTIVRYLWVSVRIFWYQDNGVDAGLYISSLWRVSKVWLILWTGMGSAVRYARASGNPWRHLHILSCASAVVPCPSSCVLKCSPEKEVCLTSLGFLSLVCLWFLVQPVSACFLHLSRRRVHSCFSERNRIITLESYQSIVLPLINAR